jgi:hypothetical protein
MQLMLCCSRHQRLLLSWWSAMQEKHGVDGEQHAKLKAAKQ